MLRDDAPYDGLKTLSVHLKSCGMEWVRAFLQAGAVDAFAACVGALCRFEERSEDDAYKIEAALACLKALMKTEEGIAAMVASSSSAPPSSPAAARSSSPTPTRSSAAPCSSSPP